jgi:hypothetical protein
MQMDKFPELHVEDYEKKLLEEECYFKADVCAASMALVYIILPIHDPQYNDKYSYLTRTIRYRFSHFHWKNTEARNTFFDIVDQCKIGDFALSQYLFAPRDICEAILNVSIDNLVAGAGYICEALSFLDDHNMQVYGANLAITRLKEDYRKKMEACKKHADSDFARSLPKGWDAILNRTIFFIRDHYPAPEEKTFKHTYANKNTSSSLTTQPLQASPDTEQLLSLIDKLENEKAHLEQELNTAEETIRKQQALIDDYAAKYDPKVLKGKEKRHILTGKQHVILALAVLAHLNRIPHARTNLSYQLSFVAGRNESTMVDYLKSAITQKECDEAAMVFQEETPFIAKLIKELPDKLTQDKAEKNKEKALKRINN